MITRRAFAVFLLTSGILTQASASDQAGPVIDSISPAAGQAGTYATIIGHGFGHDNIILIDGTVIRHVGIAAAVGITCTVARNCKSGIVQSLDFRVPKWLQRRSYRVTVRTGSSTSNTVIFAVTR